MNSRQELQKKIDNQSAQIAVIGLGYVGLPVAALFADAGFDVLGVELRTERVEMINRGECPIEGDEPGLAELIELVVKNGRLTATSDYEKLRDRDILLIDVETPVDEANIPRYDALRSAIRSLGPVIKNGSLVIVESTIAPATMTEVVLPLLEKTSGKSLGTGFFLGNCPERVMPGRLLENLRNVKRVAGGMSPVTTGVMVSLYKRIVKSEIDETDCLTAELVKTVENAYRDVQIAFANEVALICEAVGGDVWKVRELVNKSPNRAMHLPGAGVGGHCIPKDPWLLAYSVKSRNVPLRLIPAAREINNYMPIHMIKLVEEGLSKIGRRLNGTRIGVLGYAYLEESDDIRNSPSEVLVHQLQDRGAEVVIHDPWVEQFRGDLYQRVNGCDAILIMVAHKEYRTMDLRRLEQSLKNPIIVDGRNIIDERANDLSDLHIIGIGKA